MAKMQSKNQSAVAVPKGPEAKVLQERAAHAIAIREAAAKSRQGQGLSFPTRLMRG